jgi:hypothetical protein
MHTHIAFKLRYVFEFAGTNLSWVNLFTYLEVSCKMDYLHYIEAICGICKLRHRII